MTLNNALDQKDITDKYIEPFIPKKQNNFFTNAHGIFSKIDYIIGHETDLDKFKKIEIISSIFTDCKGLKLETNLKGKKLKNTQIHGE